MIAYVVTVEQFYANTFSVDGVFATAEEARAHAVGLRLRTDVHVYRCDGGDCEDIGLEAEQ